MDGNDIWEALFGICKGNVPDAMTEEVCEQLAAALEAASSTLLVAPSDRSQRAVVEEVARIIHPTAFQLRDELRRTAPIEEYSGDHFPHREEATRQADEQCAVAYDKARAVIAALQPPAADNATRTEGGLAGDQVIQIYNGWYARTPGPYADVGPFDTRSAAEAHLAALRTTGQPAIAAAKPVGEADV